MKLPGDRHDLDALAGAWTQDVGRRVSRVTAGPGWLGVTLGEDPRHFFWFVCRPGLCAAWDSLELTHPAVRKALGWQKSPPAATHLRDHRLAAVRLLPDDLVLHLEFEGDEGPTIHLLHQLFGTRGGLALLSGDRRLLWTMYPSPHTLLCEVPAASVPPTDAGGPGADFAAAATGALTGLLAAAERGRLQRALRRRLKRADRLANRLDDDLRQADRGEYWRLAGETLGIHLHELERGPATAELMTAAGEAMKIELDPALTPAENMDRCFKRARKAMRGRDHIADRLDATRADTGALRRLEAELAALPDGDDPDHLADLLDWRDRNAEVLDIDADDQRRRRRPGGEPGRPFRRYLVDGVWEVWVGRDARENDELTHRASSLGDIWLHAQGVGGSHVILRCGGHRDAPSRSVLGRVAALAALHSRARHSGLVPVLYTRRRYVRKPRKSPPGTAVCLQEKTLVVEPGIAAGVETA